MADTEYQPLTGNPDLIATKAAHYQAVAAEIARSVQTLTKIKDEQMKSQAIEKLKSSSGEVADDITKAYDRYDKTAQALARYASELRGAQDDAEKAIAVIGTKQSDADAANRTAATAHQTLQSATDDQQADAQRASNQANHAAHEAQVALGNAQQLWQDALNRKNTAAHTAATAIDDVVNGKDNHGLKDSWWDNWGSKVFDIIQQVCKWAGILSIFLGWVPILGQVLLVLAAVGAVLDLVNSIVQAIAGNGSWWSVAGAALGVALTFVGGAAFARLTKGIKSIAFMNKMREVVAGGHTAENLAKVAKMRKIMGASSEKTLGSMLKESRKIESETSVKQVAKSMFKDAFEPFHPKLSASDIAKLKPKSFNDLVKTAFDKGVITNPAKLLNLDGDYVKGVRLIITKPELLRDPRILVPLMGATGYQANQTVSAVQGYVQTAENDPSNLPWSLSSAGDPTHSIITDAKSIQWKNNG